MSALWIMPSRGRPQNVARMAAAFAATGARAPLYLRLDADDPALSAYRALALPANWEIAVGPRVGSSPAYNEAFNAHPDCDGYGLFGDDAVPLTAHWDSELALTAGRRAISYAADGIVGEARFGHGVVGGDIARALGWLMLPGTVRLYGDNAIHDIGQRLGVARYRADVVIEHWHFSNGKAPMDDTYVKPQGAQDAAIYRAWLRADGPGRATDAVRERLAA